jgi:CTP synthase
VIEYARNVLGWQDAGHAETDSEGRMVIAPLSCSLVETSAVVELRANTLIARAYGRESIEEGYHCRYGVTARLRRSWSRAICASPAGMKRVRSAPSSW